MSNDTRNKNPHGGQAGKPSEHHGSSPVELAAINDTLKAFAKRYNENKEQSPRRQTWKFGLEIAAVIGVGLYTLLTGGLLIVGALQTRSGGDQVKASQEQLAVMQNTEHRQLRAYVGLIPGDIENLGDKDKQVFTFMRKNYGATPAYDIEVSELGQSVLLKNHEPPVINFTNVPDIPHANVTLFPSAELPLHIKGLAVSKEQVDKVLSSDDFQFAYAGKIRYRDAFGKTHFTNFCWQYARNGLTAKDVDWCLHHNDSD